MNITETITTPPVPTKTVTKKTGVQCDLCKEVYKGADSWHSVDWPVNNSYHVLTTGIFIEEGESYPEDRFTEVTEFHICPDCFKGRLIPWLKNQGAEPTVRES
jgi:hypothetical protein